MAEAITFFRGKPFTQFWQKVPVLEPFYTNFEKTYNPDYPLAQWMHVNNWVPIVAIIAYMLFCYFGQIIMKDRKPFDLRYSLAAWNLFLSLFSFWGAFRTVPEMIYNISTQPFDQTVCTQAHLWGGPGNGLAVQMFILSKIPELVDTVFIVLRKKPLIFLHWYHHVTVLVYCWHAYVTESGAGLYFISMNYTVHAVMYFYYYLMAIRAIPKWFPSWIITSMQIIQMIVGTGVVGFSIYYKNFGSPNYPAGTCNVTTDNLIVGGIIYASYLYLFMEFAVKRYIFKSKSSKDE
jgi:hypothetical protein